MNKKPNVQPETTDTEDATSISTRPLLDYGGSDTIKTSPPISEPCKPPATDSNKSWRQPVDVRGLASQVNKVATMVLNGKLSIEDVKGYATLTRTIAQLISAETARARMLREPPNLSFDAGEE